MYYMKESHFKLQDKLYKATYLAQMANPVSPLLCEGKIEKNLEERYTRKDLAGM